jgi:hypothetical protein
MLFAIPLMSLIKSGPRVSPQVQAIVDLHAQKALASFVLQLSPLDLEATKMMLSVLQQIEDSCWEQCGREMSREELLSALDKLIKDPDTRHQLVQLYQERKQPMRLKAIDPLRLKEK